MNFFQLRGSSLCGFFPRNREELIALAHHRLFDAFGMPGEIEAKTPLHAKKVAVDAAQIAVVSAQDFMIAHAERGFAAVGAVRASRGDVLHFPWTRLVAISSAGQRADRANVNA